MVAPGIQLDNVHSTNLSWWSVFCTNTSCRWLLKPLPCISQIQPSAGFGSYTPFSQPLDSLLSSALFLSRVTDCAWSISRGFASMYNSTSWQRNQEDSFVCSKTNGNPTQGHCIPKTDTLQAFLSPKMIYGVLFPYCFFNIQLFFWIATILWWISMDWRDVESLQDSMSDQISCIFLITSLARSYISTFQCNPHAFFIKKPNFAMYEWAKRKFVKKVQL